MVSDWVLTRKLLPIRGAVAHQGLDPYLLWLGLLSLTKPASRAACLQNGAASGPERPSSLGPFPLPSKAKNGGLFCLGAQSRGKAA